MRSAWLPLLAGGLVGAMHLTLVVSGWLACAAALEIAAGLVGGDRWRAG